MDQHKNFDDAGIFAKTAEVRFDFWGESKSILVALFFLQFVGKIIDLLNRFDGEYVSIEFVLDEVFF